MLSKKWKQSIWTKIERSFNTFNGTLKVRFFSFFSMPRSATTSLSLVVEFDALPMPSSTSLFSSEAFLGSVSSDELVVEEVELSAVRFFRGTSTHSVISITASALSNVKVPLLLREKCRFALIGEERFREAYLRCIQIKLIDHKERDAFVKKGNQHTGVHFRF